MAGPDMRWTLAASVCAPPNIDMSKPSVVLVPPGIVHLPEWNPDEAVKYPMDISGLLFLGGLGRKP
jgi:hypothetical protein